MAKAVIAAGLVICAAPVLADDGDAHGRGVSVGVTGGTNGLGLEVGYRLTRFIGVRANTGDYSYDKVVDSDDFIDDEPTAIVTANGIQTATINDDGWVFYMDGSSESLL